MLSLLSFSKQNQATVLEILVSRETVPVEVEYGKTSGDYLDTPIQVNKKHVRDCLQETLKDMYGVAMVTASEDEQQIIVTIDEHTATIDLESFVS